MVIIKTKKERRLSPHHTGFHPPKNGGAIMKDKPSRTCVTKVYKSYYEMQIPDLGKSILWHEAKTVWFLLKSANDNIRVLVAL